MRKWIKRYFVTSKDRKNRILRRPFFTTYDDHVFSMGSYCVTEHYKDKSSFFSHYLQGRYLWWNDFIVKSLLTASAQKSLRILSIASGRAINEMKLKEMGCDVVCSDLSVPECYEATKRIFGDFEYSILDTCNDTVTEENKYDVVLCLSLIYLFNAHKLEVFFKNVGKLVKPGGVLILDSAGSPDNALNYLVHNILLPVEHWFEYFVFVLIGIKKVDFVIQDQGYFRSDAEIINAANVSGFSLECQSSYGFLVDFERSNVLGWLIKRNSLIRKMCQKIGSHIPHSRMFKFTKI